MPSYTAYIQGIRYFPGFVHPLCVYPYALDLILIPINTAMTAVNHNTSNRQQSMCSGQARPRPPRSHDGSGPHPSMGGMVPAQPQQQMGVAAMGMYPGVMPYGMMPGMHPQVICSLLKCLGDHTYLFSHDRPVVQGYPGGCQDGLQILLRAKALPHEGASALVYGGHTAEVLYVCMCHLLVGNTDIAYARVPACL